MQGFITETELGQADEVFPGIAAYFASLADKPRTFLELVGAFEHWCGGCHGPASRGEAARGPGYRCSQPG
jgi:hypothetical protein